MLQCRLLVDDALFVVQGELSCGISREENSHVECYINIMGFWNLDIARGGVDGVLFQGDCLLNGVKIGDGDC